MFVNAHFVTIVNPIFIFLFYLFRLLQDAVQSIKVAVL
jgi:hypothetical protein